MRSMVSAVALVSFLLVGGCKKSPSLVGKWTGSVKGRSVAAEYKTDDTMTITMQQGPVNVVVNQSYKVQGDTVTTTVKSVDIPGMPATYAAQLKAFTQSQVGKSDAEKIKFDSDDQVTLTGTKGTSVVLTRVKTG